MLATFTALADPNRLRIVELLRRGPRAVNDISARLRLAQPQVSKHLKTLRAAGLVDMEARAQRRVYGLAPGPLQALDAWLEPYRRFWTARLDALEARLDELARTEPPPPTKPTNRRRRP